MSHVDMAYTHHGQQGQKGVCHELPGGPLTGIYGVSADLLGLPDAGTWHPHHWHQGPNDVGNLCLGPLGN